MVTCFFCKTCHGVLFKRQKMHQNTRFFRKYIGQMGLSPSTTRTLQLQDYPSLSTYLSGKIALIPTR